MSISKITGLLLSSAAMVAGHGYVSGAVVDGTYHGGYLVNSYSYMPEVPENIGWAEKATDLGFVDGSSYDSPDIICHKEATPGAISAEVKAGGKVELQWTEWPESHHGPVITYMANCNGDCSKADKATLKFFKIAEAGLIDGSNVPGKWATDELIANNNSATVTIPSAIAAGNYVLRHEIIGLHSAGEANGAQNYPQCLNLKVTGGGKDAPDGVLGTALYKAADPGIKISIYTALDDYKIPGPALYTGAASGSSSGSSSGSETTAPATTAAPTAASTVSASPVQSSSSRHLTRTRTARPTSSPSGTPTPSSAPTSAASTSTSSETGSESTETPSTATETATSIASSAPQVTDEPDTQTASSPADSVAITSTASAQSAQSTTPVSDGDDSESSGSTTSTAGAAASSGASSGSGSGSGDYSSYLSSLSAEKLLEAIRSTLKWLVSDSKVHARALAH